MRQGKNIKFIGTRVESISCVHSKFTHKQRFALDTIVDKLNKSLLKTEKLCLVKRPYNRDDVIHLVENVFNKNNCSNYDEAINILNKQLKEKNFDIYKS